jgi:hypothetical protein
MQSLGAVGEIVKRGIVYVGGGGADFVDQSASLVADRIARSLRDKVKERPISYRVSLEADAARIAPDINLDIAAVQVMKSDVWETVLEVLEVKYQPRFVGRFARFSPLQRAWMALQLLVRSVLASGRARWRARTAHSGQGMLSRRLDRLQWFWLSVVRLLALLSLAYWIFVGAFALFAGLGFSTADILGAIGATPKPKGTEIKSATIYIAMILVVVTIIRYALIDWLDRLGIEAFAALEYQLDDSRYLAATNALLDGIEFAARRDYGKLDLLSFSFGTIIAADAIFPRRKRNSVWSPPLAIDHWITVGFPYDMVVSYLPGYFSGRQAATIDVRRWINIVAEDDFLSTRFSDGDGRGIRAGGGSHLRAPDLNPTPVDSERRITAGWLDAFILLRRIGNHRIYWDDEDARARTCFDRVVDETAAGWTTEVLAMLSGEPARAATPV